MHRRARTRVLAIEHPIARGVAAIVALAFIVAGVGIAAPAQADLGQPAHLSVSKTANGVDDLDRAPGDAFSYDIAVGCDDNECIDATLHDAFPAAFAAFAITAVRVSPSTAATVALSGCAAGTGTIGTSCVLDADFIQSLPGTLGGVPQVGIRSGATVTVTVDVTIPSGLTPSWPANGVAVTNTATAQSTTSNTATDDAVVTVTVPTTVAVDASKSWTPATQAYAPGDDSVVTVGAQNTSNVNATSLTVQDPSTAVDGATALPASNPFRVMDFVSLGTTVLPAGADLVQVDAYYFDGTAWSWVLGSPAASAALPAAASDPSRIGGVRVVFTSSSGAQIAPGDEGSQAFTLSQRSVDRETGSSLVTGGTIANATTATVAVPGHPSATDTASAQLVIAKLDASVLAGKSISPSKIPAGLPATVTLTAKNTSNPGTLASLTIAEPSAGTTFFTPDVVFDEFTGWSWPSGATTAQLEWQLSDGSSITAAPLDSTSPAPAAPTSAVLGARSITGFTIEYEGEIAQGTTASVAFDVVTDPGSVTGSAPTVLTDTVAVHGENASGVSDDTADATLSIYRPDIQIELDKSLSPRTATPGGTVVAQLTASTSADAVAVEPTSIVVEDLWDGSSTDDFWDAFSAQSIAYTDVPSGSTLTVEYATGTPASPQWHTLVSGATAPYSGDLPGAASVIGLRFTFTDPSGFAQGTSVRPNVVFVARPDLRTGGATSVADAAATDYRNVASAVGSGHAGSLPVTSAVVTDDAVAGIISYSGADGTLVAGKKWVGTSTTSALGALPAQSGAQGRTLLTWGVTTPGYASVQIEDPAGGAASAATTVFQAFDLAAVQPVSYSSDPQLRWDKVTEVWLYSGGGWHEVTAPASGWMNGTGFVGYTLSSSESAASTGVRITVEPNDAARTASTDPTAPAPGSGVASSTVGRTIPLLWTLRNTPRDAAAAGSPWVTHETTLNGGAGAVVNTVGVTGVPQTGTPVTRTASDTVGITDVVPNVKIDKTVTPTSAVVPFADDVDPSTYPVLSWNIDAWSTASSRASYVSVVEPCATMAGCGVASIGSAAFAGASYDPSTNPFERATLTAIGFTVPSASNVDASASRVALWERADDGSLGVTYTTVAAAQTLTPAQLSHVVGIEVEYQSTDPAVTGGLIPQSQKLRMTLTTRLLKFERSAPTVRVAGGTTLDNTAIAQSFDPVIDPSARPYGTDDASVDLVPGDLEVTASKSITPATITEPQRSTPVTVQLGATDGASTTAPESVALTDDDPDFWSSFQFTGLGTVVKPAGASLVRVDVKDASGWVLGAAATTAALPASVTSADYPDIVGIRVLFSNDPDAPFSATVPSADWAASAAFTAGVRDTVDFPLTVDDEMAATASHSGRADAVDHASDSVDLVNGTAALRVLKTPDSALVEPGVSTPWTLSFTNAGTGYLDVERVVDELPAMLEWDGEAPDYTSTDPSGLPTTGITVSQDPVSGDLEFTWPGAARMTPGETFTIVLGLSLLPGLTPGDTAENDFFVQTTQSLSACSTTSPRGTLAGLAATQCGTSAVVGPKSGALLYTEKWVRGDINGTLADGAVDVTDASRDCTPNADGFYRTVCAAETVVGGTDLWRLSATNTGTIAYSAITFVDPLPVPGDRLLATGAQRGSTFRPVFDPTGFATSLDAAVPAGATASWQVTTADSPCVGTGATTWNSDPTCSTQPVSTAWVDGDTFIGDWAAVTAIRVSVDFAGTASGVLAPGGTVQIEYRTVNTPLATADAVATSPGSTDQYAWNQTGITASLVGGGSISRAPSRAGVTVATGPLVLSKTVSGAAAATAPDHVTFDVACEVAGTKIDMGASSVVAVTPGHPATVAGLPLGAECSVHETGALGTFGESARTPNAAQVVTIASTTATAAQTVSIDNEYRVPVSSGTTDDGTAVGGPSASPTPTPTVDGDGDSDGATAAPGLASTGMEVLPLLSLVLVLLVIGLWLTISGNRRRRRRH